MPVKHPVPFFSPWDTVPIIVVDFETTGLRPGIDQACEVGLTRFENGKAVHTMCSFINPGMVIPDEAAAIHGITDAGVASAPSLIEYMMDPATLVMFEGAQPAAYNATFDRFFMPGCVVDMSWPWIDVLVPVRVVDRYVPGSGNKKLPAACERHGVALKTAHSAGEDSRAAGDLFYKVMPEVVLQNKPCIGELLHWMRRQEADEWRRFHKWIAEKETQE